jgi:hypothetical protein
VHGLRTSRFGVDIRGSLNLVGWLLQFLGVAFLFPAAIAVIYGEPIWPFQGLGRDHVGLRLGASCAHVWQGGGRGS